MKEDAPDHRKMKRLARLLRIPLPYANGIMERLWHHAGKYVADGGIGRLSDEDIAEACAMPVETHCSEFVAAIAEAGFLDNSDTCRYFIHDWPAHCTHYIHNRLANHQEYFADGSAPNLTRIQGMERRQRALQFYGPPVSAPAESGKSSVSAHGGGLSAHGKTVSAQGNEIGGNPVSAQTGPVSAQTGPVSAQTGPVSAQTGKVPPPGRAKNPEMSDMPENVRKNPVSAHEGQKSAHGPHNAPARPTPTPTPNTKQQQQGGCDVVVVANALHRYGSISQDGVQRFLADCLNGSGRYTETEIVAVIDRIGATIGKRVKNPIGVLVSQVPGAMAGTVAAMREQESLINSETQCASSNADRATAEQIMQNPAEFIAEDLAWANEILKGETKGKVK